jgi:hypothetical protein
MLRYAFAPLAEAVERQDLIKAAVELSGRLFQATVDHFWDPKVGYYVVNKPWLAEEKTARTCDRSLATALLYDLAPDQQMQGIVDQLVKRPDNMGMSYPPNAGWYLWALAKAGRPDLILADFRSRWIGMESVKANNTMQEAWHAQPDSNNQWSHASVAPMYVTYMSLAGIEPLLPGGKLIKIRPQPGDLKHLKLEYHTFQGIVHFESLGMKGARNIKIQLPPGAEAEIILDSREDLRQVQKMAENGGLSRWQIEAGKTVELKKLKYT